MKVYLSTLLRTILIYFESEKCYEVHLLHLKQNFFKSKSIIFISFVLIYLSDIAPTLQEYHVLIKSTH